MQKLKNTRDAILFAAVNCFAEKGFHGTTIREIGTACNVTDPTIYHYFESKENLFREAMNSTHHIFFLILKNALLRGADLRTELTSYFFAFTEWGKSLRQNPKDYIEASISNVFEFLHSAPASMKGEFKKKFQNKFERIVNRTMIRHHLTHNLHSLVTFFSTFLYGFSERVATINPGAFTHSEITAAVEQTMQFIFSNQTNIDQATAEWELSAPSLQSAEIQQAVRTRMQDFPHKILTFNDFRSYVRYGQRK